MKALLERLQPLGRALMLPIAVLPAAALLLRLGQPDLLDIAFMSAAGDAVFSNLGLLFAIGVAVGFARDGNGAAGLAGVVCFLIATEGAKALLVVPPEVVAGLPETAVALAEAAWRDGALARLSVPIGIISGLIAGDFYNRFSTLKLPEYLAFFAGRRFVPIVSGVAGLALAAIIGFGFSGISGAMDGFSRAIVGSGEVGLFLYGVLNRLLIVTGLHHILNNIAWFVIGDYQGVTGDLRRFFAGDPEAGAFMSGFFPVMMFGLPAACLAMYHAAKPERKKAVGGMLMSLALTAFLTGVTEPIEFTFMFLAPVLYAVHTVLTGAAMVIMSLLDVKLGFGFSAGLFDYVLNFNQSTRPLMLIPVGLVYFALYYGLFRLVIRWMDLKTPGREDEPMAASGAVQTTTSGGRGAAYLAALGGAANVESVDACTTRLRLILNDQSAVDEAGLKALGARGLVRPSDRALQVVLGPIADQVADEIRAALTAAPVAGAGNADDWLAALGGRSNVLSVERRDGRVLLRLKAVSGLDVAALKALGARGVAVTTVGAHLILGPRAEAVARDLAAAS
ncbi:PTS transporter subunit EIIC [Brevundimonas sp. BAL450]|uniref:PTS system, N-acetylglucosamine-specific IIA component / PTS system n=1 Tax=Brevundimonas abyssalis TAR-001 TaxID=1391729 RepID=A0A8E0NAS2_9CAUL|nr:MULTISPECIES: N-acetylglucosamine-specific PTS transporter subunit IIBC [Brevundimonas]MBG7614047.1 PTS transporter subunit EIIC [Brevundimonas sp. BAL450]GAD58756.1 PTS system, N-acetylglucosamine-specific IIA component / PTS system [Brevundimonas abyssalis TAR-001]